MGNLHMGWLATRPVSDVLIKFDAVTEDYTFDNISLSPLQEFLKQLQVMMARYRVGDGTGSATVSPATSCVQDSSQALYTAIKVIKQRVNSTTAIVWWLKTHPNDPQTLRFQKLVSLGAALEEQLTPLGIVRADWESNVNELTGIDTPQPFRERSIWAGLTSWRSIMPRQAYDELATVFLKHGAKLWFLRTNQVGGWQADISPLAPTELLGQIKIPYTEIAPIPIVLNRILTSLALPKSQDWLVVGLTLLISGAIALPLGFYSGFFQLSSQIRGHSENLSFVSYKGLSSSLSIAFKTFITPVLSQELLFRVLLLPHPMEVVSWMRWILWAGFILLLFLIYHLLNPKKFLQAGYPTSLLPISLTLTTLLGIACTVAYALTGSFWAIASIHWIVVLTWRNAQVVTK
jgi:predicted Abi (CAAX) family protease